MSALGDALASLRDVLDARRLRWFVFGAQAVMVRGAPRATQDLDVTVEVDRSALPTLVAALVDLVIAGSGLEAMAMDHAADLVVMKVLAGRGKDLDDVRALLASGDVDVAEARDLLGQLEEALGQSDLVPALDAALRDGPDRTGSSH